MKNILILMLFVMGSGTLSGQNLFDNLLKARALKETGKADEAIRILTDLSGTTEDSRVFNERADAFILKGDYSAAIADLNRSNLISPSSGDYGLSRVYALKGDVQTSLYHLEANIRSSFKKSEKEIMLDPAFSLIENRPEWRQFWKKDLYSSYEKSISEIEFYVAAGMKEEARGILAGLNKEYGGAEENIYAGALISIAEARYGEAVKSLSDLLSMHPEEEKYLRNLAKAQSAAGNPAGASSTYTTMLKNEIPDPGLLILRAECFRKTGETDKAMADIMQFLGLYPEDKAAIRLAGKVEAASGDNLNAIGYFSRNLKLHPDDPQCYTDRGDAYLVSKSWDWAINDYSMALDLQPGNSDIWLNKGIALLNSGKNEDACFDFRKSFQLGNKRATEYISRNCIK